MDTASGKNGNYGKIDRKQEQNVSGFFKIIPFLYPDMNFIRPAEHVSVCGTVERLSAAGGVFSIQFPCASAARLRPMFQADSTARQERRDPHGIRVQGGRILPDSGSAPDSTRCT